MKRINLILKDNLLAFIGIIIFILFVIISISLPYLELNSPTEISRDVLSSPSKDYFWGTNDIGQDIFSRVCYGMRNSILLGISVGIISTSVATILGSACAMIGGRFDRFILRICDIFFVLPSLVVYLLISSYLQPNIIVLIIMFSIMNWQSPLKAIRTKVLTCKENLSISAAVTFGASDTYIFRRHILKEISPLIISSFIRATKAAIFTEVRLAYLGMTDSSTISWGIIMNTSMNFIYLDVWKWWLLPTGILLSMLLMSLSYMGFYIENKTRD